MTDPALLLPIVIGTLAIVVPLSCAVSRACGGHWALGLLGPAGWMISMSRGIRDAIREAHAPPRD